MRALPFAKFPMVKVLSVASGLLTSGRSVEVVRRGKVRRAKLYYLRNRRGKSARISENTGIRAKKMNDAERQAMAEEKARIEAEKIAAAEAHAIEKAAEDAAAESEAKAATEAKATEAEALAAEALAAEAPAEEAATDENKE